MTRFARHGTITVAVECVYFKLISWTVVGVNVAFKLLARTASIA